VLKLSLHAVACTGLQTRIAGAAEQRGRGEQEKIFLLSEIAYLCRHRDFKFIKAACQCSQVLLNRGVEEEKMLLLSIMF
jgi:hypothetical protein